MIRYQIERVTQELIDEVEPLLISHWEEVEENKEAIPLKPDYSMYINLYNMGSYKFFSIRDDTKLIGYCGFFIFFHHHHSGNLFAQSDILYIKPEYRNQNIINPFLDFIEDELRYDGCSVVNLVMKAAYPFEGLCINRDMNKYEIIYSKRLGE